MMIRTLLCCFLFTMVFTGHSQQVLYDECNLLNSTEANVVRNKLIELHQQRGVDARCFIAKSLQNKTPNQFTIEKGNELGVGIPGLNNGIMILIAPAEQQLFIANSFGIQWIITDEKTEQIINTMSESFKADQYQEGILKGLEIIKKELTPYLMTVHQADIHKTDFTKLKGMVVAFEYTNTSSRKFMEPASIDKQFDPAFKTEIKTNGRKIADLCYNKYMGEMVSSILTAPRTLIFARVKKTNPAEFELLGILKK